MGASCAGDSWLMVLPPFQHQLRLPGPGRRGGNLEATGAVALAGARCDRPCLRTQIPAHQPRRGGQSLTSALETDAVIQISAAPALLIPVRSEDLPGVK